MGKNKRMCKLIIKVGGLAIAFLVLSAVSIPHAVHAATPPYTYNAGSNTCVDYFGFTVDVSYCGVGSDGSSPAGRALGGASAVGSAGYTATVNGLGGDADFGGGATFPTSSPLGGYRVYDVAPGGRLSIQGVGGGGDYSRTAFSNAASSSAHSRINETAGIKVSYIEDFGDWGFRVELPVTRSWNNSGYSAYDNTSVGLAMVPVYHLLFEQVAGVALDVGGVLAGQYASYDDSSALANGPAGFAGFENPGSAQAGGFVKVAKTVAAATRLSLGAAFVDDHNFNNHKILGQDNSVTMVDLGVVQGISPDLWLGSDLKYLHLHQYEWGTSRDYGEGALTLGARLGPRASLSLGVSQTFANSAWSTTTGTANFVWWLN